MHKMGFLTQFTKCEKLKYYIVYTLFFSAISTVVFSWFYFNGKSLIWQYDGTDVEYLAVVYIGKYLRQIIHDLFSSGSLNIPMFDFSIGYGTDILTSFGSAIGDPLNLLFVFVPESKTEILYSFLLILRIYLSGVTFSVYCKHMKKPQFATLCGALFMPFVVIRYF